MPGNGDWDVFIIITVKRYKCKFSWVRVTLLAFRVINNTKF